ncbi:hypothetical protein [Nocardia sp. NPDC050710]|uniref:hypothetical protein n=1 Tax=Nocardia sp. NPDC050710 TaxID=3157220 RepID=UPI0033E0E3F5
MKRGDALVARIEAERDSEDERTSATMELLSCLSAGYPIERIGPLLRSDNIMAVKSGAFLASEMSNRAAPLVDDIQRLLASPVPWIRHDAIQVIWAAATASNGRAVAQAASLVNDPHVVVRSDAMHLLANTRDDVLRSALEYLDSALAPLTSWLLDEAPERMAEVARHRLDDPDPLTRRFAAIALVRHAGSNTGLLADAANSNDDDVASFASERLKRLEMEKTNPQRSRCAPLSARNP